MNNSNYALPDAAVMACDIRSGVAIVWNGEAHLVLERRNKPSSAIGCGSVLLNIEGISWREYVRHAMLPVRFDDVRRGVVS